MKRKVNIKENNRRRGINRRRGLFEAMEGDVVSFSELNSAQQDYVRNNWETMRGVGDFVYDLFNDMLMDDYDYKVKQFADKCSKASGLYINTDAIHWDSNSQGPYPQWSIAEIFGDFSEQFRGNGKGDNEYTLIFNRYGSGDRRSYIDDIASHIDVELYMYDPEEDDYITDTVDCDEESLRAAGCSSATINRIMSIVDSAQEFIEEVWDSIRYVCTECPDDDWAMDLIAAGDSGQFEIIDDETVECVDIF